MQYIVSIHQYVLYDPWRHWYMSWQVNPLTAWQWQYKQTIRQQVTKFQLVKSTWNIKSAVNKVIPDQMSTDVFCQSSSHRTLKFTFSQTLISRDFSILFRLPWLSIPHTETGALRRPVRLVLLTDQQPKLIACCMLFFWTSIKSEFQRLVSRHHIGLNISNVLVSYPYGCGCVV